MDFTVNPSERRAPNILITGTPGTGKTTLCEAVATALGMTHLSVSGIIQEQNFHSGRDAAMDTLVLDEENEDDLLEYLQPTMQRGGVVLEFHASELFPESWIDLVLVLRTDNTQLYDRLAERGYTQEKITENITAEIMNECEEEAREAWPAAAVVSLQSNTTEDMESNLARITAWHGAWLAEHA